MRHLLFACLVACLPLGALAQGNDLSEAYETPDTTTVALSDTAELTVDGKVVWLDEVIEVPVDQNLELHVRKLAPNSRVFLSVRKTGVQVEQRSFQANARGEIVLEVTTPRKKIGATVDVNYTASSGKAVAFRCRVIFR